MPLVAVVADAALTSLIGGAITDAVASVTGSILLGDIATGAVVGAVGGAAGAAAEGQNIWKGAETGAIGGGVSGGVTGALQGAGLSGAQAAAPNSVTGQVPTDAFGNQIMTQGSTGSLLPSALQPGTSDLGTALTKGLGTAAGALATGQPLGRALEEGGISGLVNYAVPGTGLAASAERGALSSGLNALLSPSQKASAARSGVLTGATPSSPATSPGSAALAQVLNVGGPVFGSESGETKSKKAPWNVESLRYMGSES